MNYVLFFSKNKIIEKALVEALKQVDEERADKVKIFRSESLEDLEVQLEEFSPKLLILDDSTVSNQLPDEHLSKTILLSRGDLGSRYLDAYSLPINPINFAKKIFEFLG